MTVLAGAPPVPGFRLDWAAYWRSFCDYHGEPLEFEDRLLFESGWRYAFDYAGPEYPPPDDRAERRRLRLAWLRLKRVGVAQKHADLRAFLAAVRVEMLTRRLPLHVAAAVPDPESETGWSVSSEPLTDGPRGSLEFYDGELARLAEDLSELDRKAKDVEENP